MAAIPIIDLAPVHAGAADTSATARQLLDAFRARGFAYLTNHGIPPAVIDEAFQRSRDFFALPADVKASCARPAAPAHQRGYSRPAREKLSQMVFDRAGIAARRRVPDVKESFDMGRDDDAECYNVWPAEGRAPGFRGFWTGFHARMGVLEGQVLRLVGEGLGVDGDDEDDSNKNEQNDDEDQDQDQDQDQEKGVEYLANCHSMMDNQIRLLHYPPVREEALRQGRAERIAAHTDFGTLTMLFQDEVGGLEVEDPREPGRFVGVPHVPGTVVVNVGDLLMRWSNDLLRSTMHRVGVPSSSCSSCCSSTSSPDTITAAANRGEEKGADMDAGSTAATATATATATSPGPERESRMLQARYSIAYFCAADKDCVVDCLPGCAGPARPRRYSPIRSREYVDMRMAAIS